MTLNDPKLPRYGELVIAGAPLDALARVVAEHLSGGWSRATDIEESRHGYVPGEEHPAVFRHEREDGLPAALLFLMERGDGSVYVPNVVPAGPGSIDESQYNALLQDFHDRLLPPAVDQLSVEVTLDVADYDLAEHAGEPVRDALRAFSRLANKSTGAAHPSDAERFDNFVLIAAELPPARRPSAGIIGEWLVADGWDEETAFDLSIQYERGLRLLDRLRARHSG